MGKARNAIMALGLLASGAAYAGTPGWSLSETSGQVTVVSTGLTKIATRGGSIAAGDIINTGRTGRAVLVRGQEYLVVAPNSRIRVADPAKSGGLTQIIEDFGNVIYKIKKMTMPHFAVETPFLAAVVKGTTFSVTVTDKGASVQVIEGKVEVATRDGGASFMVLPGDIGSVNASAPGALKMQGRETRTIISPTPAVAAAVVTASINNRVGGADLVQTTSALPNPISEGAIDLLAVSGGMVTGDPAMTAMAAIVTKPGTGAEAGSAAVIPPVVTPLAASAQTATGATASATQVAASPATTLTPSPAPAPPVVAAVSPPVALPPAAVTQLPAPIDVAAVQMPAVLAPLANTQPTAPALPAVAAPAAVANVTLPPQAMGGVIGSGLGAMAASVPALVNGIGNGRGNASND